MFGKNKRGDHSGNLEADKFESRCRQEGVSYDGFMRLLDDYRLLDDDALSELCDR